MKIELIKAFKSLDMKKPRITRGTIWEGYTVAKIEEPLKSGNDLSIHLIGAANYSEVKLWETIKRFNNLKVEKYLKILDTVLDDSNYSQVTFSMLSEIQKGYKELSNFYYDALGSEYLTTTEKSLEN
tara:strand:+ start:541 stop:921 length:381 start_codon:yes stop_codon:yes gene_type:complete